MFRFSVVFSSVNHPKIGAMPPFLGMGNWVPI